MDKWESIFHMTSPYSSYILVRLHYPGYTSQGYHAYIDTGSTFCVARKDIAPNSLWEHAKQPILGLTVNSQIHYTELCSVHIQLHDKLFPIQFYALDTLEPD